MIIEDNGEMITGMVQDCLTEDFYHATHHRDSLQKELEEIGQLLRKIGEVQMTSSIRGIETSKTQTNKRVKVKERDPSLPMPHANTTVHIRTSMLQMDEIVGQTVDTERGVNQYQVQFKTFFNLYLNHSTISNEQ
jgi:hypothetical protein